MVFFVNPGAVRTGARSGEAGTFGSIPHVLAVKFCLCYEATRDCRDADPG